MGILQPTGGTALVDGLDCFQDRVEVKRRVGIIDRGKLAAVGTLEELRASLARGGSLAEIFFAVTGDGVPPIQGDGAASGAPA